ncbi:thioesterase domain-containing protein [Pelosinus fermentans]|uniref:Thioesterase n=1 Tax=Pelosinus fermentans JBW45 TaxID=1192197 RepID=I9DB74_9FIRM|nr:thioesterase domain-containing protein [Pelosinus fermentans]AJQ29664.1 Thioesterase [Pelosinus fermentans JBW45]
MNSKDIFRALQAGKMSPEDAEEEVRKMIGLTPQQPLVQSPERHIAHGHGEIKKTQSMVASPVMKSPIWPQFPELIHLNKENQGKPVFWIHGGSGTVSGYRIIARKIQRPFYGIEPRGWIGNRSPLYGIQAMAAYYVHIILTVQPEGPYDIGGYSLGGRLAYEVTRQLQELGQTISTIVMVDSVSLDSPYNAEAKKDMQKIIFLQALNMVLMSKTMQEPEKFIQTLIHRDEVNLDVDDETFFQQLIMIAKARGLPQTEAELYAQIQKSTTVHHAYGVEHFSVLPLTEPQSVTCYYFRNKSGVFYGELEPYFRISDHEIGFDHQNYWKNWEKNIPDFHMMDVDSPSHIALLAEPKAYNAISDFCETLYSEKEIVQNFRSFIKK